MNCDTRIWTRLTVQGFRILQGLATTQARGEHYSCRVLILGGGSGGCTMAAKLCKLLGKGNVTVVEPACEHYYQPLFTLVGGGAKKLTDTVRPMENVLPKDACWLRDEAEYFDPVHSTVCTKGGDQILYEFLIVAVGIQLNFEKIPGLKEGLSSPCSGVCSIYSPQTVERVFKEFERFNGGNAIFTQPATPIKCAGAPQKIAYLFDHYLRKNCKHNDATIVYNTGLPVIFSAKHYADALWKVANKRSIIVNLNRLLVEVKPQENIAIFKDNNKPESEYECKYSLLHVTPPQSTPKALRESKAPDLVDSSGYLKVCQGTLQHVTYKNIFGIGDCINVPTSKTAAAVAAQNGVLFRQISAIMCGKSAGDMYDGYSACPIVTGYNSGILAEFDYDKKPLETFPCRQDQELTVFPYIYTTVLPYLYWEMMLKGNWEGPKQLRKIFHPGGPKKK